MRRRWRWAAAALGLATALGCGRAREPFAAAPPAGGPAASAAAPPAAGDLLDVRAVAPTVVVDLRYATADDFVGRAVYPPDARCLLRRAVAERLARVAARVARDGLRLRVWDCYRPFAVQERFWALVPDARYVAQPVRVDGRPAEGSKHNRGAAVDLTLADADGRALPMPTGFDDFTPAAHRGSGAGGPVAQRNAARLEAAMAAEGFAPLPTEWWHFDGPGWQAYELLDVPFAAVP